jgi:tRNA nucleotidyltransferase (CCA-adding enzyme)
VVGLLTRRAVDRAMQHGLGGQPAREVMEAGEITVKPTDSIEILQQRMMRSGWGQIPVVDDEGRLLGIVTRTDLIKRWGQHPDAGRRADVVQRMEASMPPGLWRLLQAVAAHAQQHSMGLYIVGGFVRDLLLGQPNHDVDLVVEGSAIHLVETLRAAFGGDMRSHEQFGTAKWLLNQDVARALGVNSAASGLPPAVDLVSARTEFYEQPTVLPTVEPSSIKQDLYRRDFTLNTLAIRLAPGPLGELLDFYGGEQDLRDRRIRVLHSLSFVDDPTRMLRAVRLEQRLGFQIEPRTEELIHSALPLLDRVSGDRLRHEFSLLLSEPEPLQAMGRLDHLGILAAIHPGLRVDDWARAAFYALHYARRNPPWESLKAFDNWVLTAFGLFTGRFSKSEVEQLGRRLQFKRVYLNHLEDARAVIALLPELTEPLSPHDVVRRLEPHGEVGWLAGWAAASSMTARNQIARFAQEWRFVRPALNGRDLAAMTGLKPGPVFGVLLARLRQAWLNGEIRTPEEERTLLNELVASPTRLARLLETNAPRGAPD